ncbi:unnamed protein product [Lota lota]
MHVHISHILAFSVNLVPTSGGTWWRSLPVNRNLVEDPSCWSQERHGECGQGEKGLLGVEHDAHAGMAGRAPLCEDVSEDQRLSADS